MPGKDAKRTALIQVKIVALAPMPKANVVTTTKVKPGFLSSVRRLYRKSCQKVSMIRLFPLSTPIDSASDLVNGCWGSIRKNLPYCISINLCVFGKPSVRLTRLYDACTASTYYAKCHPRICKTQPSSVCEPSDHALQALYVRSQTDSTAQQQVFQPGAVEAHHHFTVYHGDGRRHVTELFKFRQRRLISYDISFGVFDLVLRKKLFHFSAEHSAGLAVNDDLFAHRKPPRDNYKLLPARTALALLLITRNAHSHPQSYDAERFAYRHSNRNAMTTPMRTNGQTQRAIDVDHAHA